MLNGADVKGLESVDLHLMPPHPHECKFGCGDLWEMLHHARCQASAAVSLRPSPFWNVTRHNITEDRKILLHKSTYGRCRHVTLCQYPTTAVNFYIVHSILLCATEPNSLIPELERFTPSCKSSCRRSPLSCIHLQVTQFTVRSVFIQYFRLLYSPSGDCF